MLTALAGAATGCCVRILVLLLEKGWALHGVVASMQFPIGEVCRGNVACSLAGAFTAFMGAVKAVGPTVFPLTKDCQSTANGGIGRVHHWRCRG